MLFVLFVFVATVDLAFLSTDEDPDEVPDVYTEELVDTFFKLTVSALTSVDPSPNTPSERKKRGA